MIEAIRISALPLPNVQGDSLSGWRKSPVLETCVQDQENLESHRDPKLESNSDRLKQFLEMARRGAARWPDGADRSESRRALCLEDSRDFPGAVHTWHDSDLPRCPRFGRYGRNSGHRAAQIKQSDL